jgi:hypothetical protein
MDLLKYGLPISVNAPEGSVVVADDLVVMQDVTVKHGEDYFIQIFGSDAITLDANKIFQQKKAEVTAGSSFSEIIQEDETGMIYKKQIDEKTIDYDFVYVKVQGDKEYIFSTGLMGIFDEEQVRTMYNSVK